MKKTDLAHLLDDTTTQLHSKAITLNDINLMLQYFKDDFDGIKFEDITKAHLSHFKRTVRVIAKLMDYTVKETNNNVEQLESLSGEIFDILVKKNEPTL